MNDIVDWLMGKEENIKNQEWSILTPCNHHQLYKSRIGILELQEHQQLLYEARQAGIFFAQLAIQPPFIFSAELNTVGCSMIELNVSIV